MTVKQITATEFRIEIARHQLVQKEVAARANLHPKYLSRVLAGVARLTPRTAADIERAIRELVEEKASASA